MRNLAAILLLSTLLFSCNQKTEENFTDHSYIYFISDTINQTYFQKGLFRTNNKKLYSELIKGNIKAYYSSDLTKIYPIDKIQEDGGYEETLTIVNGEGDMFDTTVVTPFNYLEILTNYQIFMLWKKSGESFIGKINSIGFLIKNKSDNALFWVSNEDFKNLMGENNYMIFRRLLFARFVNNLDNDTWLESYNPETGIYKVIRNINLVDVPKTSLNQKIFNSAIAGEIDVFKNDSFDNPDNIKLTGEEAKMINSYTETITLIDSSGWSKDTVIHSEVLAEDFVGYQVSETWFYDAQNDLIIRKNLNGIAPVINTTIGTRDFKIPHYWIKPDDLERLVSESEYNNIQKSIYQSLLQK